MTMRPQRYSNSNTAAANNVRRSVTVEFSREEFAVLDAAARAQNVSRAMMMRYLVNKHLSGESHESDRSGKD